MNTQVIKVYLRICWKTQSMQYLKLLITSYITTYLLTFIFIVIQSYEAHGSHLVRIIILKFKGFIQYFNKHNLFLFDVAIICNYIKIHFLFLRKILIKFENKG
jgi:hypothetical protein